MADFSSNHSFIGRWRIYPERFGLHRRGLTTSIPLVLRTRAGQYHDALAQNGTPAQRKAFEAIHPRNQMIMKTDLAKFEHTWSQLPHIVSRGAQKCYLDFMDILFRRGNFIPDELFFRRSVAHAILFKQTERIVSRRKIWRISSEHRYLHACVAVKRTAKRVDLDAIWNRQSLEPALSDFIDILCVHAHEHIISAPGGQNVTEWCKKNTAGSSFAILRSRFQPRRN